MPRLIWLLPVLLAGCMAKPASAPAFRAPAAPIWSAAAFQPTLVAGDWRQVADFQGTAARCDAGAVEIAPSGNALDLRGTLCIAGRPEAFAVSAALVGPGRIQVKGEEWWIIWVDSGYRTLAIATPSGRFGIVLDRGEIPADRLRAAREIFEFNGYRADLMTAF